ncbi:MAG: DUF167 domain-containing protein [Planctomycetes bacterium]|nr:DUF167 domain-containing protein [Planctomycetota bacterium]
MSNDSSFVQKSGDDYILQVKAFPKSSKNEIDGVQAGRLRVKVTSPPEKGKANAATIALLAKALKVSKSDVELVKGETSQQKTFRIRNLTAFPFDHPAFVQK